MKLRRISRAPGWYEIKSQCPICGKKRWCAINEDQSIVHCMRVPSDDFFDSHMGRHYRHYLDPDKVPKTKVEVEWSNAVDKKSDKHLNRVYRALIEELTLSSHHTEHLRNSRHFTDEEIRLRQYRSMPGAERYKIAKNVGSRQVDINDLLGVPGFYVKDGRYGPYWTMSGFSGLMLPFRSILNEITGWQIRVDNPPLELDMQGSIKGEIIQELDSAQNGMRRARCQLKIADKEIEVDLTEKDKKVCYSKSGQFVFSIELKQGQKYWWWSSGSKDNGASIGGPIPYHLALPSPCIPYWTVGETPEALIDCSEVWVTEGAMKADKGANSLLKPFFGIAGVGSFSLLLEPLKRLGCKHVVLAFDADSVNTPEVARALELAAQFFAEKTDMALSLAMWDFTLGKGIDNLLDNGYIPQISKILDEN
ncbi:toprim domain-containing protein [Bacillus cereus]|nr:toprim domain-containing protein [Bacillus cereus]